jgi:uncharacterized protein YndB with AHSA1/START domain
MMPKNKDLKRLTRSRMQKTGESYAAARRKLLDRIGHVPQVVPEDGFASLAGIGDKAVRTKTGRTWRQWVRALDAADAAKMAHREIARHLSQEHELPHWWSQMVTVGYERIRGLRDVGQRRGGGYEVNKSKTVPVPVARLYRAFRVRPTRERWLPEVDLTVRTSVPDSSMRMVWKDGTPIEARFTAKGNGKSQVTLQHRKLPSKAAAAKLREYWGERLDALAAILAPRGGTA